jgi:hypothetical protein
MTKLEALEELSKGEAITHVNFTDEEYIEQSLASANHYLDENGYYLEIGEFWALRSGAAWDDGYSIYKD